MYGPAAEASLLGLGITRGTHTTVTADDVVVTGLSVVEQVQLTFTDDLNTIGNQASGFIGDQAGTPAAGSFNLRTWRQSGAGNAIAAANIFSLKVNWVAYGTP